MLFDSPAIVNSAPFKSDYVDGVDHVAHISATDVWNNVDNMTNANTTANNSNMYVNDFMRHASAESKVEHTWDRVHCIISMVPLIHGCLQYKYFSTL